MQKLLMQPPTSKNRSKAVHYLSCHPCTPYAADFKTFPSSHFTHHQVCITSNRSPSNHISEFQSTALAKYDQLAHTLMRHRRWDMALGSRFLQYVQYTEASLLQRFYKRVRQCYPTLHTSIAITRHCITVWRRQGAFLLYYYDTLMETCHTRKTKFWIQSLRALRHQSMQTLTNIAAQLLRENWSIVEDLFRDAAATVHHFKKRSQPCNPRDSKPKRARTPHPKTPRLRHPGATSPNP